MDHVARMLFGEWSKICEATKQTRVALAGGVARLKGHDLAPAELSKAATQFGWRIPEQPEIVVDGWLHALEFTPT